MWQTATNFIAMASNSIRIASDLFEDATAQAGLQSRSAAQQLEYWARLGQRLEAAGMTVSEAIALLQHGHPAAAGVVIADESELWEFKRDRQARDVAAVNSGRKTNRQMSWFSPGVARKAKVKGPL
jgi:hypothetical protein